MIWFHNTCKNLVARGSSMWRVEWLSWWLDCTGNKHDHTGGRQLVFSELHMKLLEKASREKVEAGKITFLRSTCIAVQILSLCDWRISWVFSVFFRFFYFFRIRQIGGDTKSYKGDTCYLSGVFLSLFTDVFKQIVGGLSVQPTTKRWR